MKAFFTKNRAAAVIAALVFIAAAAVAVYAVRRNGEIPGYFVKEKTAEGRVLYDRILAYNLQDSYPGTPEDVLELNNLIMELYYGDIIADSELIYQLVDIQRRLFSETLLEKDTAWEQAQNLKRGAEALYEGGMRLYDVKTGPLVYGADGDECAATVTEVMTGYDEINWDYQLSMDEDGLWKIDSFEITSVSSGQ